MSNFATCANHTSSGRLDPSKHVNFAQGMVLGVDDFRQEFAYQAERDHLAARELIGYGTVSGLQLSIESGAHGPEVAVAPGLAVTPPGEFVRILRQQCASLSDWLAKKENQDRLDQFAGTDPSSGRWVRLYATLRYRDVLTDNVPIPGEPCRTEEESTAASRVQDGYKLALSFTPPDQREEDAIRDLVAWLREIEVIEPTPSDPVSSIDEILAALRAAAHDLTSPPYAPPGSPPADFLFGSPPAGLKIARDETCACWRALFRVWVTELRPLWQARFGYAGCQCDGDDPTEAQATDPEENLLLGEVFVPLTAGGALGDPGLLAIHEERRPWVVHLRMLQEWLFCGLQGTPGPQGVPGPQGDPGLPGQKGDSLTIQFSVTGAVWHANFAAADKFMRIQVGAGPFSAAIPIVGQPGANGTPGATGNSPALVFSRSAAQPATPTGNIPAGWSNDPPAGTQPLWMSRGERTPAGALVGGWSTPVRITGDAGAAAVSPPITSGTVIFTGVAGAEGRLSPPITHGLGSTLAMIRLAVEAGAGGPILAENTDSFSAPTNSVFPRVIAGYTAAAAQFSIWLNDARKTGPAVDYRIRWFAVPVTKTLPDVTVPAPGSAGATPVVISREAVLAAMALGATSIKAIAKQYGATAADAAKVVTSLTKDNLVQVSGDKITFA